MPRLLRSKDFKVTNWAGGTTTELYRLPDPTDPTNFLLRISVATVEKDGPFTLYPNVDRQLVLLNGEGMELTVDGKKVLLDQKLTPFSFAGEDVINCSLIDGACTDFNVMTKRGWERAHVSGVQLRAGATLMTSGIFYLVSGQLDALQAGDLLMLEEALPLTAQVESRLIHIAFTPA